MKPKRLWLRMPLAEDPAAEESEAEDCRSSRRQSLRRRTVPDPEAERSALQRVGLAMRAGRLVSRNELRFRDAARRGAIAGALMATDVTDNTWKTAGPASRRGSECR